MSPVGWHLLRDPEFSELRSTDRVIELECERCAERMAVAWRPVDIGFDPATIQGMCCGCGGWIDLVPPPLEDLPE